MLNCFIIFKKISLYSVLIIFNLSSYANEQKNALTDNSNVKNDQTTEEPTDEVKKQIKKEIKWCEEKLKKVTSIAIELDDKDAPYTKKYLNKKRQEIINIYNHLMNKDILPIEYKIKIRKSAIKLYSEYHHLIKDEERAQHIREYFDSIFEIPGLTQEQCFNAKKEFLEMWTENKTGIHLMKRCGTEFQRTFSKMRRGLKTELFENDIVSIDNSKCPQ